MNLSEHFTLEEMCFSAKADREKLCNMPDSEQITNLRKVAQMMEMIRVLLSFPIEVHSGFRSSAVNKAVGGVADSAHCAGLACDFTCPMFGSPRDIALKISLSDVEYDQLILEYGWVHVSLSRNDGKPRRESLTKFSPESEYECGIRTKKG